MLLTVSLDTFTEIHFKYIKYAAKKISAFHRIQLNLILHKTHQKS